MAYTLGNKCAKNLCKRTHLVQLIIETIVTCFFELGDRQSSHPVKTLLQYYGKSLEGCQVLPTPVQGQPQHLKYQNRIKKVYIMQRHWLGLPDLPYFPGALVFRPLSRVSRTEAKISRI